MELHSLENNPSYINLQTELVRLQRWIQEEQQRLLVIFEGRDTAGKGGAIMRFVRFLNPRAYRIVALPKPSETERGQWYFQRYIKHLPDPGEIVFFDRSWYNRAVVEPVMGFCTEAQYERFMNEVVEMEKIFIQDGIRLIKFWFSIDHDEQRNRLEERKVNPLQQWKLSTVDMEAQIRWDAFSHYKQEMFRRTSSEKSPWVVIDGNDKDKARLEAMRYVIRNIDFKDKGLTGEDLEGNPEIIRVLKG